MKFQCAGYKRAYLDVSDCRLESSDEEFGFSNATTSLFNIMHHHYLQPLQVEVAFGMPAQ